MFFQSPLSHITVLARRAHILALCAVVGGCANTPPMTSTQRGVVIGAGVGALAGAALGRNTKNVAVGAGVGALGGYIWSTQMEQRKRTMEQAAVGTGITVVRTPTNQLKVLIPDDFSFDSGQHEIKAYAKPFLNELASSVRFDTRTDLVIVGHTDSTGQARTNNLLSAQRAAATRQYLAARGVNSARITTAGRGEYEPIADNASEIGRSRNRRVEIYLNERG